ncbi:hypothetical protein QLL95_gp0324 [Cotonvirus japonicus]|uniref:Uncharacterized protein n=1 Tax=Cotonvirus japonicus TaxID=2811091 RepID=A0ABM7NRM3_9VIRU|nr:hypothetical protein QLL95_gp0324 [Cotonvirus japonicus]BCS82813.1 hypothetical protein [Cotonvirus japonicus]
MTRGAYSLRTLEEIKSLTDFVQKRLCVVDYYKPHFESREHMVEVWENGVIASRFHYYDGYKLTDLAQVFPFVMEWFLEQHNTSLNLDKKTDRKAFEASSLMISRLIDRLLANGYKDIQIAKNHKGGQSYYLDFKKLVSVLTSGGTLSHESLSDLYVYLQDKLIDAHEPWYNWLEQRQTKILSKTFIDGEVKHLTIKGHTYYLEELGTLVHIVCDFLLKEKPVLCF